MPVLDRPWSIAARDRIAHGQWGGQGPDRTGPAPTRSAPDPAAARTPAGRPRTPVATMAGVDVDQLSRLGTPDGCAALAAATELAGGDPLLAASALRTRGVDADLAAAALTQATLRRKAAGKFGADAAAMFFTRTGLEQATRAEVAGRRAARLAASGARTVADL